MPHQSAQEVQHLGESPVRLPLKLKLFFLSILRSQILNTEAVLRNNELSVAILIQEVTHLLLYFSLLCSECEFLQFVARVF